ncbi:MAG: phosphoribosylaminoimidazolesuccinocarboxamide synthase [Gammaproteobacteria bacterium]
MSSLYESHIKSLPLIQKGKVRDIYNVDDEHMLLVTSDRISAFDVIMPTPIPGKGEVLTAVSEFWFEATADIVANHLSERSLRDVLGDEDDYAQAVGRSMVVRKLKPLPVEAIVRGYIVGSGWKDYQATGTVCGIALPAGLEQADRLDDPLFTPSTKAAVGDHDMNIDFDETVRLIGADLAEQVRDLSIRIYSHAREHAARRGIIIADTKFEFGLDDDGRVVLIDEVLTPDSSRFWPADQYRPGISPPSFDKQFVRDYLETLNWDKTPPGPELPGEIVARTALKYREAQERLTGDPVD